MACEGSSPFFCTINIYLKIFIKIFICYEIKREVEWMKLEALTFKGGVHFDGFKSLSNQKPWVVAKAPSVVTIAMHQHIGAPCEPVVAVGDEVKVSQKIGETKAFISTPIHSSVSSKDFFRLHLRLSIIFIMLLV